MKTTLKHYFVPHEGNNYHPHFFRNTTIAFVAIITLSLLSLSLIGSYTLKQKNLLGAIYESVLVELANKDRGSATLPKLSVNKTLELAATLKAEDMVNKSYFAHISPEGLSPWYWISKAGYQFVYAGENLAINFTESSAVENAWMNSPTHRANILNNNFSEVGIAIREGVFEGHKTLFVVQMFGKPILQSMDIASTPTTEPVVKTAKETTEPKVISRPIALAEQNKPIEKVEGTNIKIISDVSDTNNKNLFVAVKDTNAEIETAKNTALVGSPSVQTNSDRSSFFNRMILRFPLMLNAFYIALGILVTLAITMLVTLETKHHRPEPLLLGAVMFLLITGAIYANRSTELFAVASLL